MEYVSSPADIDAQLAALMQKEEESSSSRGTLTKIKTEGTYRIRILPNGDQTDLKWWAKWGLHFWNKGLIGNQNTIVFVSATHTYESDHDPIAIAVRKAENSGDPALEALAQRLYAGPQFACNAMILGPVGSTDQVGDVVQLAFNKTLRDNLFSFSRMVSPRFFMLDSSIVLHIRYTPHKSGRGLVGDIVGREAPMDITAQVDQSKLKSMKELVEEQVSNAKSPNLFTGNLLQPLAEAPMAGSLSGPAVTPPAALSAPAPVAAPVAAPVEAPVAAPAAPVVAPVVDIAPATAPAVDMAPAATPASEPAAISDDELARQLMSMVN